MLNNWPLLQELPTEQDIGGASGTQRFYFPAYGKGNSDRFPYNVPNEKISSELARVIGLPVPEALLFQNRGEWLFLSRAIATSETGAIEPPGAARDVQQAVNALPGILEEMTCCDLFLCNNDRNPGNFLCDHEGRLWLIDYGNALFYRPRPEASIEAGIPRLKAVDNDLGALFDMPYDFVNYCRDWQAMQRALERIAAIPDYFIENTVTRLPDGLLTFAEREFVIKFLQRRKTQMTDIIRTNVQRFPNLTIPPLT